ncbi:AI-2E family transporter [Marinobacterium nitratireducens]|uniref:AI-2E family transporter n=1 Tax=Marinobacterium nitratireducens TaxID=518897 RepID=A0A917Z7N0_9GAMM|nr:AI-2E family transporter [Marinobacterium nitratireducens]GGO76709.1 AI-2E family transporter [Marinobacterium nitratireducens]
MQLDSAELKKLVSRDLMDMFIRLGVIVLLLVLCARIFSPFAGLLTWALILAVALYPLHQRMANAMGGRQGRASTLMVLIFVLLLVVPTAMLGTSLANHIFETYAAIESKTLSIKPPAEAVAQWPLIGERVYQAWSSLSADIPAFVAAHHEQIRAYARAGLSFAGGIAGDVLLLLGALIVAGVMMAYAVPGSAAIGRIIGRFAGPKEGPRLHKLSTATIRSVAVGVVGVAFIQGILMGLAFLLAGIPAAGFWALVTLIFGILQLPGLLIALPAIGYVWSLGDGSTVANVIYTVLILGAALADNFLKPMLLGRGVEAPMPIILLGALGGMLASGIVGLFVGATLLAVGYVVFMEWVHFSEEQKAAQQQAQDEPATRAPDDSGN